MKHPIWAETLFHKLIDTIYSLIPQPFPGKKLIESCKIVSHRGEHDNLTVFENTLSAFDIVRDNGIWGIELDIRWTKDLYPVVFHDKNLKRVFHLPITLQEVTLAELKKACPAIPSLEEVVSRYGKSLHLMVEIKEEKYPDPERQNQIMKDIFSPLTPANDYHFVSLTPHMFRLFNFPPGPAYLPIAQLNMQYCSELAARENYGGMNGQYFLIKNSLVQKHRAMGQNIGTGFISSRNVLFRELSRGVEWLFTNHAVEMQKICNYYLSI